MKAQLFETRNPWSAELLAVWEAFSPEEIQWRLSLSGRGFTHWKSTTAQDRFFLLGRLGKLLAEQSEILSLMMSEEMGKPLTESRAEVAKCRLLIEFYTDHAGEWLQEREGKAASKKARIRPEPLGGILLVMPWNFPLWQVLRAAIPALCTGNVILLKHAPNVFRFSAKVEMLFREAGFPEGVFQELRVDVAALPGIISDQAVSAVSFTGSENAGRSLAALAGQNLRKIVLELGGSDPFLVFPDASLKDAVSTAAASRMINNGQSCISAKRFIVHQSIMADFVSGLSEELEARLPGDPRLATTRLGPLARPDLVSQLHRQLSESMKAGARLEYAMDASFPSNASFFLPVIISGLKPGMPAFEEETFGPLAAVSTFESEEEALILANQSRYGLGATLFSGDEKSALRLAGQLQCGTVSINSLMRSDPALPFGGLKASGFGKELGLEGMAEFSNLKVIMQ